MNRVCDMCKPEEKYGCYCDAAEGFVREDWVHVSEIPEPTNFWFWFLIGFLASFAITLWSLT